MNKTKTKIQNMVLTAVLTALIILMTFTGIAYIPIGPLKLTVNIIPVAVGAVLLGPAAGLFLGAVFGLSSFFTCFGLDAFGALLLGINPVYTFIMCVIPRLLCGIIPAYIYKTLQKIDKTKIFACAVACVSTALINTVTFLGALWLLFGHDFMSNPQLIELLSGTVIDSFTMLLFLMAGVNAIIEAATALVLGPAVIKALMFFTKKK